MYKGGFPDFSIEKPISLPWKSDQLLSMQESGEWVAEIKLNEHRGFICTDETGKASFYSYRGPKEKKTYFLPEVLEGLQLPPCSVFDGGHLARKDFGSRLWIFDILVLEGQKLRKPFEERKILRDQYVKQTPLIWLPLSCDDFVQEFQAMLQKRSTLIEAAAKLYEFPQLAEFVEGFVIKKKSARPCFPKSKKETAASFKLRIADVFGDPAWVKAL